MPNNGQCVWTQDIIYAGVQVGKVLYGLEPHSGESSSPICGINYQLLEVMLLMFMLYQIAVHPNQLRTIAFETADPIDWHYPHNFQGSTL